MYVLVHTEGGMSNGRRVRERHSWGRCVCSNVFIFWALRVPWSHCRHSLSQHSPVYVDGRDNESGSPRAPKHFWSSESLPGTSYNGPFIHFLRLRQKWVGYLDPRGVWSDVIAASSDTVQTASSCQHQRTPGVRAVWEYRKAAELRRDKMDDGAADRKCNGEIGSFESGI